jgi:hypothetical protein
MGLEQERRIGVRELAEPPDQRVAVGGALGPPLSSPKVGWLALVAGPFGVVAEFCDVGQGGVQVGFRDEAASVQVLAVLVDHRHAGLIGRNVGTAFPPGKVNTDEPSSCHAETVLPLRHPNGRYAAGRLISRSAVGGNEYRRFRS